MHIDFPKDDFTEGELVKLLPHQVSFTVATDDGTELAQADLPLWAPTKDVSEL